MSATFNKMPRNRINRFGAAIGPTIAILSATSCTTAMYTGRQIPSEPAILDTATGLELGAFDGARPPSSTFGSYRITPDSHSLVLRAKRVNSEGVGLAVLKHGDLSISFVARPNHRYVVGLTVSEMSPIEREALLKQAKHVPLNQLNLRAGRLLVWLPHLTDDFGGLTADIEIVDVTGKCTIHGSRPSVCVPPKR